MGWSIGYDSNWKRDVGYGVPAYCDQPGCQKEIDRGLAYVCGGQAFGGDDGCGLYFCEVHGGGYLCARCSAFRESYEPKPDHPDWIRHKMTDPSWEEWRKENAADVSQAEGSVCEK